MATSRRDFLGTAALAGAATLIDRLAPIALAQARQGRRLFLHGVASGDPLHHGVILWTRVTPPGGAARTGIPVSYEIARDSNFRRIAGRGMQLAAAERDFTVKVDALGLEPGATYYYRFSALGEASVVGRTRTLPRATSRVRLAVASCSNLPFGYFNAYRRIAARQDLDAVLHLGDYIYEYANKGYGDGTAFGRIPMPDREITTLEDYRTRHAQYKSVPICRRRIARIPGSPSGTTTSSRTTRGATARRITIRRKAKAPGRRGATPPCSPITNGCRFARIGCRASRASIARSRSAALPTS